MLSYFIDEIDQQTLNYRTETFTVSFFTDCGPKEVVGVGITDDSFHERSKRLTHLHEVSTLFY